LWQKIEDEPIITKPKLQPIQKHIPKPLPIPKLTETDKQIDLQPGLYAANFKAPVIQTGIKPSFGIDDGVARPIVRVEPKYPAIAARDGLEGWVKLSFSITTSGTVNNIQVLDAEPKRVFNQAAKRALAKWKYKPNIQAGKAQAQDGMMVMLDFKLAS
jgi:protein TonB